MCYCPSGLPVKSHCSSEALVLMHTDKPAGHIPPCLGRGCSGAGWAKGPPLPGHMNSVLLAAAH